MDCGDAPTAVSGVYQELSRALRLKKAYSLIAKRLIPFAFAPRIPKQERLHAHVDRLLYGRRKLDAGG